MLALLGWLFAPARRIPWHDGLVIRGILLDFYGTVVADDDDLILDISADISAAAADSVTPHEVNDFWWDAFFAELQRCRGHDFCTQREITRRSLAHTAQHFKSNVDVAALCARQFAYWGKPNLHPDAAHFLATSTLPVCVVSNIDRADLESALDFHNLDLPYVVTSEDARSYKPQPECFLAGLEMLGLAANEVLHVGDSLMSDVAGANALGISVAWLNRNGKKLTSSAEVVREIHDLHALASLLAN